MARSEVLDVLRNEETSLKSQLVAIQRAIEAIELADGPAGSGRGRKAAGKVAAAAPRRKRPMTEEQRRAISERMRRYWASRREGKSEEEPEEE